MTRIVLLFCHGGSFTKECWKPITKRLQQSPLLQRVPCEIVTEDLRFHGEKSDDTIVPQLVYEGSNKTSPRVDHPLRVWVHWAPGDLLDAINRLRGDGSEDVRVIGIGHSMGAAAMLYLETTRPGTFEAIIAFEPVNDGGRNSLAEKIAVTDMLVGVAMNRPGEWNSWDEVVKHFKTDKMFRRWHPESVAAFLEHGVRKSPDGKYRLATPPLQEAAIYSHTTIKIDFPKVKCPVNFQHGARSYFFNADAAREVAQHYPDKYSIGDAIPKTTHTMVLEDPATCAQNIVSFLEKQPVFQPSAKL